MVYPSLEWNGRSEQEFHSSLGNGFYIKYVVFNEMILMIINKICECDAYDMMKVLNILYLLLT